MIEILFHHILQVLFPPVLQFCGIIIFCLVDIPYIHILIHHQHSLAVAGLQKIFGAGIMRGPNGIIAVFLQDPDLSFLCFREGACTQNTVIMMDTGTPKDHSFSVYGHSFPFIPVQGADAENFFCLIFSEVYF